MNITYATTNKYKLAGANQALLGAGLTLTAPDRELPDVPEIQSDSQEEVSIDKAQKYYELLKKPTGCYGFWTVHQKPQRFSRCLHEVRT